MSTKQEKIEKMLEMQRRFIALDREKGVGMDEYFLPDESSELHSYREDYMDCARDVIKLAHEEKGSKG